MFLIEVNVDLSKDEKKFLDRCLLLAIEGDFFPDWEFSSLVGVDRDYISQNIEKTSYSQGQDYEFRALALACIGNLLSYPHGKDHQVERELSMPKQNAVDFYLAIKKKLVQQTE